MTSAEQFPPLPVPWVPHAYQKRAAKFLVFNGAAALFLDPGLGKSAITLAALKVLLGKGQVEKVLILAPLRVCHSVWPNEVVKWADFNGLTYVVLHGKDKDKLLKKDVQLYIMNPEGLDWLLAPVKSPTARGKTKVTVDAARFKRLGFDTLVVDELSKFKHPSTQRFKSLKQVLHLFDRRWGLTGSPAPNGLLDLFGQCFVLDQGRTLGKFISHYRKNYFDPSWDGFSWTLKEGADQQIYKRLKPLALRMAATDYLEMPELIENVIRVELPAKARQVYDQLEEDLIAKIDKRVVVAANAATASMKCRQVASGGVYLDPEIAQLVKERGARSVVNLHEEKLDALEDLVNELQGSPLLVAYDFGHDLERLLKRFGKDTPVIGGGVSAKRSDELERRWNRGELPLLLVHPQAVAHGLNLQEAGNHVCWHTPNWNYELYDQLNRRVLRQGNKAKKVFVHLLLAKDTVDEAVWAALKGKRKGQQALFDALKARARR